MSDAVSRDKARPVAGAGDYFALLKPRVMSLVVFTALVGMVTAPGFPHPLLGAVSLLAIAVGAGASGALNMWLDADIDAVMERTEKRPVPSGRIPAGEAAVFGGLLAILSVIVLYLASNALAAALLSFTIFFYVVVYSVWLKRMTPQNIVIGGAAGALPPVIGWACVTGTAPLQAWVLFAIVFLWTPPHFWALSLYRSADYKRAGIPMMPVVKGEIATRRNIFFYSLLLLPAGAAPFFTGTGDYFYLVVSLSAGGLFVWKAWRVLQESEGDYLFAKKLFGYSIVYLSVLFAVLLAESAAGFYM